VGSFHQGVGTDLPQPVAASVPRQPDGGPPGRYQTREPRHQPSESPATMRHQVGAASAAPYQRGGCGRRTPKPASTSLCG